MHFFTKLKSSINRKIPALKSAVYKLAQSQHIITLGKGKPQESSESVMGTSCPTTLMRRKKRVIKTKIKKIKFNYSIELIPGLLQAHQDILRQMSTLDNAAYEKSIDSAFESLQTLIDMLDAKIHQERSKLYPYLQKTLVNNIDNYTTMRRFRKETDKLATVLDVLEVKYAPMKENPGLVNELEADASKFNAMLIDHIRDVETQLYPLYQPGN